MTSGARALLAGTLLATILLVLLGAGRGGLAVVGDEKADQRLAPDRVSLAGVAERLNFSPDRGRFALYVALAEEVPGAAYVVVSDEDPVDLDRLLRIARGSAASAPLEEAREPFSRAVKELIAERAFIGLATRSGSVRNAGLWWEWEIHLIDADARDLVIHAPGDLLVAVDARLLPPDVRSFAQSERGDGIVPVRTMTSAIAGLIEAVLLLGLLLLGGLLLPRELVAGPLRAPTALMVGLAALGVAGSFARGALLVLAAPIVTVVLHALLQRWGHPAGWRREDFPWFLASAFVLVGLGVAVRALGLVHVSTDSVGYLDAASAVAASGPTLGTPPGSSPSLLAVHALGASAGIDGIFSLGPAVMLTGILLLLDAALRRPRHAPTIAVGLVSIVLLVANDFIRLLTMLVNSHAYVAGLLVVLAVLWRWTLDHPSDRFGVGPAAGLLAAAVALGRPEGAVIILLFLAGTIVAQRWIAWRGVWFAVGGVVLARPAVNLLGGSVGGGTSDLALIALGLAALLAPFITRQLSARSRRALPVALMGASWVVLVVSADRGRMPELIANTRDNLLTGAGGWGLVVPALLVLLMLAAALSGSQRSTEAWAYLAPLASFVGGFVPAMLLLRAFGSESPGRVHWHDSNNRMWLHLVPILLLFVVEAVRAWGDARRSGEGSTAGPFLRLTTGAVVVMLALPALAWKPVFERESPRRAELLAEQPESLWKGDGLGGEAGSIGPILVGLQTVLASVPLDRDALAAVDPSRPGEVCVGVRLGTFGRPVSGGVEITVASGRLDSAGIVEVQDLEDLDRAVVCLDLDEERGGIGLLGDDALVMIRGRGTLEGAAPAVMLDEAGAPVLSADLSWFDAPRRDEPFVRLVPRIVLLGVAFLALLMLLLPLRLGRGALERT